MNQLGAAGGFFLGPLLVQLPPTTLQLYNQFRAKEMEEDKLLTNSVNGPILATCNRTACQTPRLERHPPDALWGGLYPYGGEMLRAPFFDVENGAIEQWPYEEGANGTSSVISQELQEYLRDWIFNYMVVSK